VHALSGCFANRQASHWVVAVLQFVLQLHAMWGRDIAGGPLAPAAAALQMGAKERAVYLGHRLSRNIKAWLPVIKA
jgi:hypothetical protein